MILSNQVLCHNCGESPWSATVHDFVTCGCLTSDLQVSVDGGQDYCRRLWGVKADFTDISIIVTQEHYDGMVEAITDKTRNDLGHICNLVRYLRDEMDINVSPKEEG